MKKVLLLSSFVLIFTLFFSGCGLEKSAGKNVEESDSLTGVFSQFASTDINGNPIDSSVFKGKKLTMVNIWATYCGPCINEMPDLGEINREYADKGFQIIGIPIGIADYYGNIVADKVALAKEIIIDTKADYIHIMPSTSLNNAKLSQVTSVPETIFVDENGCQVGSYIGSRSKEAWTVIIDELMEKVS